jgi:hypothetical protein
VPFLRLTRDRRGIENTFLMHADRPGDRPRLLYWYRTAPGIVLGRAALDEDAIRAIEEQHPDIDFDWPAILALSEVMTPEDEAPARPPQQQRREKRRGRDRDREARPRDRSDAPADRAAAPDSVDAGEPSSDAGPLESVEPLEPAEPGRAGEPGLVDELAGREIASRLRARYAEIAARIDALEVDGDVRDAWFRRADAIDPDAWDSPEAVLQGVSQADALFEKLKSELPQPE